MKNRNQTDLRLAVLALICDITAIGFLWYACDVYRIFCVTLGYTAGNLLSMLFILFFLVNAVIEIWRIFSDRAKPASKGVRIRMLLCPFLAFALLLTEGICGRIPQLYVASLLMLAAAVYALLCFRKGNQK